MEGIFLIDKPSGISSFDVIRELRKKFPGLKMGHLGTLDPLATGLLVLFCGKALKQVKHFQGLEKTYVVTFELGSVSDTFDRTGKMIVTGQAFPDLMHFQKTLATFEGEQEQITPAFSAVKVGGIRAYRLARKGLPVSLGKRKVRIFDLQLLEFSPPLVTLRLSCSSGTYVRSFVHELGEKLFCGAVMNELRRERVGPFLLTEAKKMAEVSEKDLRDVP